jgi:hypothetical protein
LLSVHFQRVAGKASRSPREKGRFPFQKALVCSDSSFQFF